MSHPFLDSTCNHLKCVFSHYSSSSKLPQHTLVIHLREEGKQGPDVSPCSRPIPSKAKAHASSLCVLTGPYSTTQLNKQLYSNSCVSRSVPL